MKKKHKVYGIYTYDQDHAKYLAVALDCVEDPKAHEDGYYGHYHDKDHKIHIWFGEKRY